MKFFLQQLIITTLMLFVFTISSSNTVRNCNNLGDDALCSTKISPEIVKELEDFETLISKAKIEAIVAEHFLFDASFQKAFKFLRSNEAEQMQQQLLDMPEIIQVLSFLHMTVNATICYNYVEAAPLASPFATDGTMAVQDASSSAVINNEMDIRTTDAETTGTDTRRSAVNPMHGNHASAATLESRKKDFAYQTPQLEGLELSEDDLQAEIWPANLFRIDIVQLMQEDSIPPYDDDDDGISDHHLHHHEHPFGTFSSFVEDIIAQLPHAAYQNMIIEKCKKNSNFAKFYHALRSPALNPLVEEVMKTPNVAKIIARLSEHSIDVNALKPLAFKVISWGPNINGITNEQ